LNTIRVAFLLRNRHGQDLGVESPGCGSLGGFAVTLERIGVLRLTSDAAFAGHDFAGITHVPVLEAAPEAVVDHRVDHLAVTHAQTLACARQQVRRVAHRLHAAGHND
jgi:hypothetical protein